MIVSTNKVFPLDESPITTFNPGDSTTSISIFSFSKFTDLRYSAQYSGLVELYFPEFLNFFIIESRIPNSWYLQRL